MGSFRSEIGVVPLAAIRKRRARPAVVLVFCAGIHSMACTDSGEELNPNADASIVDGESAPYDASFPRLPDQDKGYELYTWPSDNEWCFTLISGTNRQKYRSEIAPGPAGEGIEKLSACSIELLLKALESLPSGEGVAWAFDGRHLIGSGDPVPERPDAATVELVAERAKMLGLRLSY